MKIGFENIRAFKELTEFEIRPITVLTGPNNSGKSVVSKTLHLVKNGLKKDSSGRIDLTKLYFDDDIVKQVGSFKENVSRESTADYISFRLDSDEFNPFGVKNNHFTFYLKYSKPEKGNNFCLLHHISVKYRKRLIIDLELINLNRLITENENRFITQYENFLHQNIDNDFIHKRGYTYQKYLDHHVKNKIYLKFNKEPGIISNILFFIQEQFVQRDSALKSEELNGPDYLSNREIMCNLNSKYSSKSSEITFASYFGTLVLENEDFFTSFDRNSASVYENYIKHILDTSQIKSHKEFLSGYHEFESKLGELYLNDYFKDRSVSIEQSSTSFFNSDVFKSFNIVTLEEIEHPLSNLFKIEHEAREWFKNSNFDLTKDYSFIIETFSDDIKYDLFDGFNYFKTRSVFISNILNFNNFDVPEIINYKQNEVISEYYLENNEHTVNTTYYKFGNKYHLGDIDPKGLEFVNKWIWDLGLGDRIEIEPIKVNGKIIGSSFSIVEGESNYSLKDNGYGINKLIQILLELATFKLNDNELKKNSRPLLILEEPESNLHPSFQSKLAEILAEALVLFYVNILVETHSEYLIRKLQYLIASEDNPIKSEDVCIYYMHDPKRIPEGEKQVYKLDIREDGFMNNDFGKGFFDESSTLSLGLLNLKNFN